MASAHSPVRRHISYGILVVACQKKRYGQYPLSHRTTRPWAMYRRWRCWAYCHTAVPPLPPIMIIIRYKNNRIILSYRGACAASPCTAARHMQRAAPRRIAPHAPHRTAPHRAASHRTAQHRTVPPHTAPHRTAPHRIPLSRPCCG